MDFLELDSVEIKMCDDIFVKSMVIPLKHTLVPQHSHTYDHMSMLAVGSVRVWKDDVLLGDYVAPCGILIEKFTKHRFLSLVDNTLIYCIHHIHDAENVEIHTENKIRDADIHYMSLLEEIS